MKHRWVIAFAVLVAGTGRAFGDEIHVSPRGHDGALGTNVLPLRTISAAAQRAQPGDTVTVHAGVYREQVRPPRGGTSETNRITYQAAQGEKVVLTGSERATGWQRVSGDTWKWVVPNTFFGAFNPFAERIRGDWFDPYGRAHHTGSVYLNGAWLIEASELSQVLEAVGKTPLWFAQVDGADDSPEYLLNVAWFQLEAGTPVAADASAAKSGTQVADCSEGGTCVGFIRKGDWLRYNRVDFGSGSSRIDLRAAAPPGCGGVVELRLDGPSGERIGECEIAVTGGWQTWRTFSARIKRTAGTRDLCLVFLPRKAPAVPAGSTVVYAQFPGVDPNEEQVEVNARPTVFSPSAPHVDYLTLRGFDLRNAATNWAPPTAGQIGLVTAYWCKGWIIEGNEISYSRCSGIALGKYSDQWDGTRGTTEGYLLTIDDALKKDGWSRDRIGGHVVRGNHIHHCEQTGIVGSLGCAFSKILGNEIHDIHVQGLFGGAEMAGIKFHGAIDVLISGNHIYRCGPAGGLWLDWMAQGTHVIGNLFHDNEGQDLFCEVDHGPYLVANNLFLSGRTHLANSQGGAYVHNLAIGGLQIVPDGRKTPFHRAHSTEWVGLHDCPVGDVRWINNLLAGRCSLAAYDGATWPVVAVGNVFAKGGAPSRFDADALLLPEFDPGIRLIEKADGWYLEMELDPKWREARTRHLVTTGSLGVARIPDLPFENADGSPLKIDTDYFGMPRDPSSPFPGPFESVRPGRNAFRIWPKGPSRT